MGRNRKDHIIGDDDKIGIQFVFKGLDYKTIVDHLKTRIDPETKKPYKLSKFLGVTVSKIAADIRAGKLIKI
jgi:hypothetical protein